MTNVTDTATASALDYAREQGRLSGEVRMLKWAVGAAFVALIAALGAIYTEMNQGFRDVNMRIDQLTDGVTDVRERLTRIEGSKDSANAATPLATMLIVPLDCASMHAKAGDRHRAGDHGLLVRSARGSRGTHEPPRLG